MIALLVRKFFLQTGIICPLKRISFPLLVISASTKILFSKKIIIKYFVLSIISLILIFPSQTSAKNRDLNRWLTSTFTLDNNEYEGIASIKIHSDPFDAAIKAKRKAVVSAIESAGVNITSRSTLSATETTGDQYSERIDMVSSNKILSSRVLSSFVSKKGFIWYRVAIKIDRPVEIAMVGR